MRDRINQTVQKETNLSIVMYSLLTNVECTRVKLAEITKLTQASITKFVNQLIEWGTISEMNSIGSGIGRKATQLHVNSEKYRVAAVRINRNYISLAIYDIAGKLYDSKYCNTRVEDGAWHSFNRMLNMLESLLAQSEIPVMSIGVAVPGPYNYDKGYISLMSGFPGWNEINIKHEIEKRIQIPTFVDQDANCGALAEMWHSNHSPGTNIIFIAADRGIGAGLILGSAIYRGRDGFAGEFGHASINIFGPRCECGNRGCLELYASTIALENAYNQDVFDSDDSRTLSNAKSAIEILALVRQNDPAACRAYRKTVVYLCMGVVGMINAFNPNSVIFAVIRSIRNPRSMDLYHDHFCSGNVKNYHIVVP